MGVTPFDFDPDLAVFTPAMAIRAGTLFAGAPIVQGNFDGSGTSDVLSLGRGAQVHDNFYESFDPYQGTIVITRLVPELDRDATIANDQYLYRISPNYFNLYRHSVPHFMSQLGNQEIFDNYTAVAGAGAAIAARWDCGNTLDGTNYLSHHIDNATDFGAPTQPTPESPGDNIYIGNILGTNPINAILEAPAFCRLPLWDGDYGVDINGSGVNIIAELYNGGAYEDLAKLIPAWHITAFLPTDATPGALGTAGQMWGWDYGANVLGLGDGYCATTYGASNWATEATPSAGPADIASTVDQIFGLQGYQWTSDAADEGVAISLAGLDAGENFLLVVDAHEEGVTTTGANLLLNPGFETGGTGGNFNGGAEIDDGVSDDFDSWNETDVNDGAGNKAEATATTGGGGAVGLKFTASGAGILTRLTQGFTVTPGAHYQLSFWARGDATVDGRYRVYDSINGADIIAITATGVIAAGYAQVTVYFTAPRACTAIIVLFYCPAATGVCYFDTSSVKLTADDIRISIVDDTNGGLLTNFPDWDFGAGSGYVQMAEGVVTFELPTNARHGVGADCTAITIKVLGTIAGQTVFLHQALLYENLTDNPSLEGTYAGVPPIPPGWTDNDLDAGDTQASSGGGAIIHSGSEAMQFNVGAVDSEFAFELLADPPQGSYVAYGGHFYGDGAVGLRFGASSSTRSVEHTGTTVANWLTTIGAVWAHEFAVLRTIHATDTTIAVTGVTGAGGARYADDVYAIPLRAVTLTVTAANEANSTENGGIRIDGYDNGVINPIPPGRIFPTEGWLRIGITHRHDTATNRSFGNITPRLFTAWGDATNYIFLDRLGATSVRLIFNDGGGQHIGTWAVSTLAAADFDKIEVQWDAAHMELRVDGVVRATIAQPVSFVTMPTQWYVGTDQAGAQQIDAVFSSP